MQKFGHILKIPCKKIAFDNSTWEESFKSLFT